MQDKVLHSKFSRRTLVVGAAAGSFALASDSASAQRCPLSQPDRIKGPPVWMNMDQQELDEAYDNDVYAFNAKNINQRRDANNEIALSVVGHPMRVAYGPTEAEKVDIYKTKRANAPTMIFIHGGSWRGGRSSQFTLYAEPFVKVGTNFVVVDFTNVQETNGDLFPMVDQCRRAVAWVYRNAATFVGNPNESFISAVAPLAAISQAACSLPTGNGKGFRSIS
jgi:arylformamidase